jgi:tetratricopeptide (TPR) repeat protein
LITTRNPNSKGIPAQGIEIDNLAPNDAVELFSNLSELGDISGSLACRKKAEEIVEELGYLPLAIEQSAAYIRETSTKPDDFLALYQKNRSSRQQLHKWVPEGNRIYEYSVTTTWQMSFDLIKKDDTCPAATLLLQLFAFLNPDVILFDFLEAGSEVFDNELRDMLNDRVQLNKTIRVLQRFSLIRRLREKGGISIHRLVQQMIQNEMEEEAWLTWWEKIAQLCRYVFPTETTDLTITVCRRYEEQVLVPLSKSPEIFSIPLTMALSQVANFLMEDGKYKQSEDLHEKDLRLCEEVLGERHTDTLISMANLASTYRKQGRWDEAVVLEEKVLEVRKEVLGELHPDTLTSIANLAWMKENHPTS